MMTKIELKAKNASDAVMVPTVNERFFSTSKSSSGGWGSADSSLATASRYRLPARRLRITNHTMPTSPTTIGPHVTGAANP